MSNQITMSRLFSKPIDLFYICVSQGEKKTQHNKHAVQQRKIDDDLPLEWNRDTFFSFISSHIVRMLIAKTVGVHNYVHCLLMGQSTVYVRSDYYIYQILMVTPGSLSELFCVATHFCWLLLTCIPLYSLHQGRWLCNSRCLFVCCQYKKPQMDFNDIFRKCW